MTDQYTELRDWMFRAVTFEAEAEQFRASGIRIGFDQGGIEARLLEETLAPFSLNLRNQSIKMSRIYAQIYCLENSARQLVRDRLLERYGPTWWELKTPNKVKDYAIRVRSDMLSNTWLEGESGDDLTFITFGHLTDIIINNWADFADIIPTQHWLKQKLDEIEKSRNWIAHNRFLQANEFIRLELHVRDWIKQVE